MRKTFIFSTFIALLAFVGFQQTIFAQYEFRKTRTETIVVGKPPAVTTGPAQNVGENHATLTAFVDGGGLPTNVWFEYSNANLVARSTDSFTVNAAPGTISRNLTGLSANTTYLYKVCAENAAGSECGSIFTFQTQKAKQTVVTKKDTVRTETVKTVPTEREEKQLISSGTWALVVRSLIFLAVVLLAIFIALRIFNSRH